MLVLTAIINAIECIKRYVDF